MNSVHFVQGTPNAYIHEPGILHQAGKWIGEYGQSIMIITGNQSWGSCGERLITSLKGHGIRFEVQNYRGECSYEEVERLTLLVEEHMDLIVGVGGGKVLDTAKALASRLGKPFVAIPTLAATCAATANLSVMYSEEGVYLNYVTYVRGTMLCLVDTEVIAKAPVRYLGAGIADTLAKWIECPMTAAGKKLNLPTIGGLQIARLCYDTLLKFSVQAMQDSNHGVASEAVQQVIDANILMSSMVAGLGGEWCRSAAAHAIHNGLTVIPETHSAYHGEKVAYGILVQLVLENRSRQEIEEVLGFYQQIGLPFRLSHLGIARELTQEEWHEIARVSMDPASTMANMSMPITSEMILNAFEVIENWQQP